MKVRLKKTIIGEYGGIQGKEVDLPKYVADKYVSIGYAERLKPCNCDDPKKENEDDCGCDDNKQESTVEPKEETAVVKPEVEIATEKPARKKKTVIVKKKIKVKVKRKKTKVEE